MNARSRSSKGFLASQLALGLAIAAASGVALAPLFAAKAPASRSGVDPTMTPPPPTFTPTIAPPPPTFTPTNTPTRTRTRTRTRTPTSRTPTRTHLPTSTPTPTPTPNPAGLVAVSLAVDGDAAAGTSSNTNSVLDPGETVVLKPAWRNGSASPIAPFTGAASNPTGPGGATYILPDATASYPGPSPTQVADCGADCYQLSVSDPEPRPEPHWDASFDETLSTLPASFRTRPLHVGASFTDVPTSHDFYRFVETIFHNGVTAGTAPGFFSPDAGTTREQMAVFLLVSKEEIGYLPPACVAPIFNDVPCSSPYARWIHELSNRGITAGCGGGNYCPTNNVTREQMAVYLLVTHGGPFSPSPCIDPLFTDVPCSSGFAPWINELFNRGIAAGCGGGNYCPADPVTRGQMAVFLTTTFGLTLYGP